VKARYGEAWRDSTPRVSVDTVAQMGVAELEGWLGQALNPQVPVEVLERLRGLEAADARRAESCAQAPVDRPM
jgi:hypothetical protein